MRNVGLSRKHKIADRWENRPYVVVEQPHADIPVYIVKWGYSVQKDQDLTQEFVATIFLSYLRQAS